MDSATNLVTLEPTHETLLRQWGNLKGWLEEDFALLVTLEGVRRAARDWDANARDPAWVAHGGARLEEAARLDTRPDLAALLDVTDRAYLAACRDKDSVARAKEIALVQAERRAAQRTRIGLVVSAALAMQRSRTTKKRSKASNGSGITAEAGSRGPPERSVSHAVSIFV